MTEKLKQYFLLQITTKLLQISSALLVTNYDSVLTNHGSFFITNIYDKVLANCDRYYKNYDKIITNYDNYYKLEQNISCIKTAVTNA